MIDYLQAMGITRWQLRPALAVECYRLLDAQGQCTAVLATQKSGEQTEHELLMAIIRALKVQAQEITPFGADTLDLVSAPKIIILGQALASLLPLLEFREKVIITHSPRDMLKNPALKAEVWQKIKP